MPTAKQSGAVQKRAGHALASQLVCCVPLTEGSGTAWKEIVNNITGTEDGVGSTSWVTSSRGNDAISNTAATGAYLKFASVPFTSSSSGSGDFTMVAIGAEPNDATGWQGIFQIGESTRNVLNINSLRIACQGSTSASGATTNTVNEIHDWAWTAGRSGNATELFLDGSSDYVTGGTRDAAVATTENVYLLGIDDNPLDGELEGIFIFQAGLTVAEVASFVADPWDILESTGGGGFNAAWAIHANTII